MLTFKITSKITSKRIVIQKKMILYLIKRRQIQAKNFEKLSNLKCYQMRIYRGFVLVCKKFDIKEC